MACDTVVLSVILEMGRCYYYWKSSSRMYIKDVRNIIWIDSVSLSAILWYLSRFVKGGPHYFSWRPHWRRAKTARSRRIAVDTIKVAAAEKPAEHGEFVQKRRRRVKLCTNANVGRYDLWWSRRLRQVRFPWAAIWNARALVMMQQEGQVRRMR